LHLLATLRAFLRFGPWSFSGAWSLDFGALTPSDYPLHGQPPLPLLAERGRDGSCGLQPTVQSIKLFRRGATAEEKTWLREGFKRRSATRLISLPHRGLKPTATVMRSLRDRSAGRRREVTTQNSEEPPPRPSSKNNSKVSERFWGRLAHWLVNLTALVGSEVRKQQPSHAVTKMPAKKVTTVK